MHGEIISGTARDKDKQLAAFILVLTNIFAAKKEHIQ